MTSLLYSRLVAAGLIGAVAIGAANAQGRFAPGQSHDGVYVIDVTTKQGSCGAFHWVAFVFGGRFRLADYPIEGSIKIDRRGVVGLAFAGFGEVVTARGRLARGGGSGTWYSPTSRCAGSWRAKRQGSPAA
jgi:hypothetical protein